MTLRKVSVGLEADVAEFIAGMEAARDELSRVDRSVESLDRSINKIPLDSAKAAAAMKLLGGNLKEVSENIDRVGNKSSALSLLDSRIRSVRNEVKQLATEFEKTGDIDVFRRLGNASAGLKGLQDIRKSLARSIEDGVKDSESAFDKFGSAIEGVVPDALATAFSNPYVAAAATALAALLAAEIGATVGGAIIAATAAGVVALGVVGAVKDDPKRLGEAWSGEIDRIKAKWLNASVAFVAPTEAAIHRLGTAINNIPLDRILSNAAKFVEPLSRGLAGFLEGVGRGIDAVTAKAGPVLNVLKEELPQMGHAVEMFFSAIAGGNKGAADGLRDTLHVIEALIVTLGVSIRAAEDFWHVIHQVVDALGQIRNVTNVNPISKWMTDTFDPAKPQAFAVSLDGAAHGIDKVGNAAKNSGTDLEALSRKLTKTAVSMDTIAQGAVDKIIGGMLALDQANIAVADSLDKVSQSFKENGRALDIHTAKGRTNRTAVLQAVSANLQLYDAQISSGISAQDAASAYDANTRALESQLRKAGLTKTAIDGLIGKYRNVPSKVNTILAIQGLTDAINNLADLLRMLNNIPKSKTTIVRTVFTTSGNLKSGQSRNPGGGFQYGGIRRAAEGLILPPRDPGTVLVGEPPTGGEALIPLGGITQSRAMSLAQVVGDSYGFNVSRGGGGSGSRPVVIVGELRVSGTNKALGGLLMDLNRKGDLQFVVKGA